jgi:5,10-methenyltetrahydrofolate synthetase
MQDFNMNEDDFSDDSSPCFAHHLVGGHPVDPQTALDVSRFRKSERQRLYAMRKDMPLDARHAAAEKISSQLDLEIKNFSGAAIAVYWPIRGELDLRNWMKKAAGKGATIALPVVVEKDSPVAFHQWEPECRMVPGYWKIPVPAEERPVTPDVVIVPLLGVDRERYRLGNGGGYYDRTLASLSPRPLTIGVGQSFSKMPTIFPMPWDIPMDRIVLGNETESEIC